ncbi:hypothetical protein, variant 2 [Aphanomyces astaci]|nr:hypothetical protein, variant 3 [Aphanomyces astaci]XP_009822860.1 hypothetical protein, variant 2 [Aphanomyces astaci]ETV87996.1 hypothetical protein, variant 2 [Aphanomyces astaci]ETV87997.1 hypothetical protein, variant 3 [Aphanomyces astaci]|eukprot:XP_009822859.1 hypothetical protein, variant 3 [Aphanomyces astaci]
MIAAVRMVVASGFASYSNEAHLCVHPTYGPWFGLRAAIVFACPGPTEPVYHEPATLTLPADVSQRTRDLFDQAIAVKTVSAEAKSIWFRLRVGLHPSHPFMYSDAQVRFHYANSPESRKAVIAAVQSHTPIDYVLEPPTSAAVTCRRLVQTVLTDLMASHPPPDVVLLSGGLDTSIIAEASACDLDALTVEFATPILTIQSGITVRADPAAQDATYASAICHRLNIPHHCLEVSVETLLEHVPVVSRILTTFDPMELRNAIVIYHSLLRAKELGYQCVVTGDAADELFAGYSFYASMPEDRLQLYRHHIARIMRFSAQPLAAALGLTVRSPFLDPRVVEFALSLGKHALVGDKTPVPNGKTYGKLVLRQAFPEAFSQWRDKEPIEQGAGTSQLRLGYFGDANVPGFYSRQRQLYQQHHVVLRDHEHLVYFEHFLAAFGGSLDAVPKVRDGDDPCPACRFDLSSKDQDFCITCGFWPARTTDANAASAKPAMDKLAELLQKLQENDESVEEPNPSVN